MKTKEQLLAEMDMMYACATAVEWVRAQRSACAEELGLACARLDWKLYFLARVLSEKSLRLFASRLGQKTSDFYKTNGDLICCMSSWQLPNAHRRPEVINDCWRAWCRS